MIARAGRRTLPPRSHTRRQPTTAAPVLLAVLLLAATGCSRGAGGLLVPNQRPTVRLTAAPRPLSEVAFLVDLEWAAFDADGQVVRYAWALDPPAEGDTAWTSTREHGLRLELPTSTLPDPPPPPGQSVVARDQHVFALVAFDNEGGRSPVASRAFTSTTVAPETVIESPTPNNQGPISTRTALEVRWRGIDPDAVVHDGPVAYRYRLVPAQAIRPDNPEGITAGQVQAYFGADLATGFAGWDSTSADTTSATFEALVPGTRYYLAVASRDEAGAWESRFRLDTNVLQFRPTLVSLGPQITVSTDFFTRTLTTGGVSLVPSRIASLEIPEHQPIVFRWSAKARPGAAIAGFRWVLDVEGEDISNETPRDDDGDFHHWSSWSLTEDHAVLGPFEGSADSTIEHYLYVEARDNLGFVSLFPLRLQVVRPRLDRPLLVINDIYGSHAPPANAPYPTEAEVDTFYYAVGGFPDRLVGGTSRPGAFAGLPFDTLDYEFFGRAGIPLSVLGRYRVVAWYVDNSSTGFGNDSPYGGSNPMCALRYVNTPGKLNTFAIYLRSGGKAFLFGEGATTAIANGSFSSGLSIPQLPYSSSPTPSRSYVLRSGCALYDFCHLRSELNTAGTVSTQYTLNQQLQAAIPYLPAFRGPTDGFDRSLDPRIGPGAERTALRWGGLPRLTMAAWRGAPADPAQRSINLTWYVSQPLWVTEGTGGDAYPVLDTLYLVQSRKYNATPDGKPDAVHYHGSDPGEVVWFGFPLHFFEVDQARQAVQVVMRVLGVEPDPPAARARPVSRR